MQLDGLVQVFPSFSWVTLLLLALLLLDRRPLPRLRLLSFSFMRRRQVLVSEEVAKVVQVLLHQRQC